MARHYVRLPTMVRVAGLPRGESSMEHLIGALARADEFKNIILRRCEPCAILPHCSAYCVC